MRAFQGAFHANPDHANHVGDTALIIAVRENNEALAAALLEAGADARRRNQMKESAFDIAERQSPEMLDLLRENAGFILPGLSLK